LFDGIDYNAGQGFKFLRILSRRTGNERIGAACCLIQMKELQAEATIMLSCPEATKLGPGFIPLPIAVLGNYFPPNWQTAI
jgi:hypothetical protein